MFISKSLKNIEILCKFTLFCLIFVRTWAGNAANGVKAYGFQHFAY